MPVRDTDRGLRGLRPGAAAGPLFLERRSYRRRRVMDAARLLPLLGAALWAVPLLWAEGGDDAVTTGAVTEGVRSSVAIIYIFGVWAFLSLCALILSLVIRDGQTVADDAPGDLPQPPGSAAKPGG